MTTFEIILLGPVGMKSGVRSVPLGTPKQRSLLAALALLPGRPVPSDVLVERLWGDSPPEKFRKSLYTYVARLRRLLKSETAGAAALIRATDSYCLIADPDSIDIHRSRSLLRAADLAVQTGQDDRAVGLYAKALRLWRGEPLAGLRGSWVDSVRAGLKHEQVAALTNYFATQLRLGRHGQVIPELSAATLEHPLDEVIAGQLMVSLYRTSRHADAIGVFHRTKEELAAQLGLDPGPGLRKLYEALLRNDSSLLLRAG